VRRYRGLRGDGLNARSKICLGHAHYKVFHTFAQTPLAFEKLRSGLLQAANLAIPIDQGAHEVNVHGLAVLTMRERDRGSATKEAPVFEQQIGVQCFERLFYALMMGSLKHS
jgi:hypothetical protein